MKKTGILMVSLLIATNLLAQPNFTIRNYSVAYGKKASYYNNEAGRLFKKGQYNASTLNAANALRLATKKGQISEAQGRLIDSYDRAVQENLNRIESLQTESATFVNDQTVTDRAVIVSIYKIMIDYNGILTTLPRSSFDPVKRKDPKLDLEIIDFKDDLKQASANLEEGKKEAAAWHYQQGRDLGRSSDLKTNKQAARHFRWAMAYVPSYEDSQSRYEKAKLLGTTRLGVVNFTTASQVSKYGDLGSIASDEFIAKMPGNYEFFEIVSRDQLDLIINEQELNISGLMDENSITEVGQLKGVNVLLVGKLSSASQDRQQGGGTETYLEEKEVEDGKEKYIDSGGKEKTRTKYKKVTAYVKFYHKSASGNVIGSFKLLDVKTGSITRAGALVGNYSWEHKWATYTGDKRALKSSNRSLVNKGPAEFPSRNQMVITANRELVENLVKKVKQYADQVGKL